MSKMADMWPRRVSQVRAALTASGRVLSLVPSMFKRRKPDRETAVAWDSERLFVDGDAWFDAMLAEIAGARRWVSFEVYIFEDDEIGKRVAAALAAAAQRGVTVRLLVDGVGSMHWVRTRAHELARSGVIIRVYHPPPWAILPAGWPGLAVLRRCLGLFRRINRRNHRKVCLVDRHSAWVGSFNVDRRHLRSLSGDQTWRDTGARVEGVGVRTLERALDRAWRLSWRLTETHVRPIFAMASRRIRIPAGHLVRLNNGMRLRRRWRRELFDRIGSARSRVWITSAYFVPDRELMYALALAAVAGADVRVLVPMRSDVWFMPWIGWAFYAQLARSGIRVYEYQPSMIHAKTLLIDDWASVGSTNLNSRSMFHDLEADVVLTRSDSREALQNAFLDDLGKSRVYATEDWKSRPRWQRFLGRIGMIIKHWV